MATTAAAKFGRHALSFPCSPEFFRRRSTVLVYFPKTGKAERVCKHDSAHIESETVTATGTTITAATCKEKGKMKHTATFVNTAFVNLAKHLAYWYNILINKR